MALFTWGHFRILTGTLIGGALGFYIKHRIELRYKEKLREEIIRRENEQHLREGTDVKNTSELLSDS